MGRPNDGGVTLAPTILPARPTVPIIVLRAKSGESFAHSRANAAGRCPRSPAGSVGVVSLAVEVEGVVSADPRAHICAGIEEPTMDEELRVYLDAMTARINDGQERVLDRVTILTNRIERVERAVLASQRLLLDRSEADTDVQHQIDKLTRRIEALEERRDGSQS